MKRRQGLLFVVVATCTEICTATSLLPGNADRGKDVFRAQSCSVCHSLEGEGGKTAPDLGLGVNRGFSPYVLAGLLWNHAPVMWAAMDRKGFAKPELSEQQAADLFVYFFAARYLNSPATRSAAARFLWRSDARSVTASGRRLVRAFSRWPRGSRSRTPLRLRSRCGTTPRR